MSELLISRSPDLQRLREDGYEVRIVQGRTLCIDGVPYRHADGTVARGTLVSKLELANDATIPPRDHVVRFAGAMPHGADGAPLPIANSSGTEVIDGVEVHHSFSRKPRDGYADYHDKMTTYVAMLEGPAQSIDPGARARTHKPIPPCGETSVFVYADTATPRAGLAELARCLDEQRVAIVGLGGTGSYILDLVAKTGVAEIHLFDGDRFIQHNTFRSPGAHRGEEFRGAPNKADYFGTVYRHLHRQIFSHPYRLDESNIHELKPMSVVFLAIDDGPSRRLITSSAREWAVPVIDAGMGLALEDGRVDGIVRVTTMTKRRHEHFAPGVCVPYEIGAADDVYATNIQIAELNALAAALAVVKWKKLLGFYRDNVDEHHTAFTIEGNQLANSEHP